MRQEPEYLIIGSGRLARHLAFYLSKNQSKLWFFSRSPLEGLEHLGTRVGTISDAPDRAIRLLLLKDDVLVSFCSEHVKELNRGEIVQCSGSLSIQEFPIRVHSYHPLFTFPLDLYPIEKYPTIPFVGEKGSLSFQALFPHLKNPVFELRSEHKIKYHALTSSICNFLSVIIQQFSQEREEMDLEIPTAHFQNIASQALQNAFSSPKTCLTGPIARQDSNLVQKHLGALEGSGLNEIYQGILRSLRPTLNEEMQNICRS